MSGLSELYHELIIDHGRNPRHFGRCEIANRTAEGFNPLCGDKLTLYLRVEADTNRVVLIRFEGTGCAISMASASLMAETLQDKTVPELQEIAQLFHEQITAETALSPAALSKLGKLSALSGVRAFPSRVKCATLVWHALQNALKQTDAISTTE